MKVAQSTGKGYKQGQAFFGRKPATRGKLMTERARHVRLRIRSHRTGGLARIVRQLHDVIKVTGLVVAADLQNVYQAIMRAGYRFKFLDAAELAFKRTGFLKAISIDEL